MQAALGCDQLDELLKVDQMASGLCLPAAIHLGSTSGKHLIGLELALPLCC